MVVVAFGNLQGFELVLVEGQRPVNYLAVASVGLQQIMREKSIFFSQIRYIIYQYLVEIEVAFI